MKSIALAVCTLCVVALPAFGKTTDDTAVRRAIIQESIASYPGTCPCPYNTDRRGHSCGHRSAYSRPGGYAPLCYERDITAEMIARYHREH